jgi:hypothetical protein
MDEATGGMAGEADSGMWGVSIEDAENGQALPVTPTVHYVRAF